jgi:hypothetical protein
VRPRDLRDRGVEDLHMVGAGVRSRVPRPQQCHQQLSGVVAGREQGVMAVGALERSLGADLVGVRDHDRGVQADHDRLSQVSVTRSRSRDPPVPGNDLPPHPRPGLGPRTLDPAQLDVVDLVQAPPCRRRGRHRPEQPALVPQHPQVIDRGGAVGDRHRQVGQDLAPVEVGAEPPHPQRRRQPVGQSDPIAEQPQ